MSLHSGLHAVLKRNTLHRGQHCEEYEIDSKPDGANLSMKNRTNMTKTSTHRGIPHDRAVAMEQPELKIDSSMCETSMVTTDSEEGCDLQINECYMTHMRTRKNKAYNTISPRAHNPIPHDTVMEPGDGDFQLERNQCYGTRHPTAETLPWNESDTPHYESIPGPKFTSISITRDTGTYNSTYSSVHSPSLHPLSHFPVWDEAIDSELAISNSRSGVSIKVREQSIENTIEHGEEKNPRVNSIIVAPNEAYRVVRNDVEDVFENEYPAPIEETTLHTSSKF